MAHIRVLDPDELPAIVTDRIDRNTMMARLLSHRPEGFARYLDEHQPAIEEGTIDRETKELVRLLNAQYTRCRH